MAADRPLHGYFMSGVHTASNLHLIWYYADAFYHKGL